MADDRPPAARDDPWRLINVANAYGYKGLADFFALPGQLHNIGASALRKIPGVERAIGPARHVTYPEEMRKAMSSRGTYPTEENDLKAKGVVEGMIGGAMQFVGPGAVASAMLRNVAAGAAPALEGVMRRTMLQPFRTNAPRAMAENVVMDAAAGAAGGAVGQVTDDPSIRMLAELGAGVGVGNVVSRIGRNVPTPTRSQGPLRALVEPDPQTPPTPREVQKAVAARRLNELEMERDDVASSFVAEPPDRLTPDEQRWNAGLERRMAELDGDVDQMWDASTASAVPDPLKDSLSRDELRFWNELDDALATALPETGGSRTLDSVDAGIGSPVREASGFARESARSRGLSRERIDELHTTWEDFRWQEPIPEGSYVPSWAVPEASQPTREQSIRSLRESLQPPSAEEQRSILTEARRLRARQGSAEGLATTAPTAAATALAEEPPRHIATHVPQDAARIEHAGRNVGRPVPARAGNLNLEAMDSQAAIKRVLDEASQVDDPLRGGRDAFLEERRGVRTWEDTEAASGKILRGDFDETEAALNVGQMAGMSAEDVLRQRKTGTAWNAEWIETARELLNGSAARVLELSQRANVNPSASNKAAVIEEIARLQAIQGQVSGVRSEAGRALNIIKKVGQTRSEKEAIDRIIKMGGGDDLSQEMIGALSGLKHPAEVAAFARHTALAPKTKWKILEGWLMGLLSGPQTHAVNMTGNTLFANYVQFIERPVSATMGAVENVGRRAVGLAPKERLHMRQVMSEIYGSIEGVRNGFYAAGRAWDSELEGWAIRAQPTRGSGTFESEQMGAIGGRLGKAVRTSGRLLQAEDELHKGIAFTRRLYGLGMRDAMEQGVPLKDVNKHIKAFVANPPKKQLALAQDYAKEMTFTRDLGSFGKGAQRFINSSVVLKAIVPFFRTPVNLGKEGAYRGPLALVSPKMWADFAGRNGSVARHNAQAKVATGAGLIAWALHEAENGNLTGRMPDDPAERSLALSRGQAPYSGRIGGKWVSFNRLDPFSMTIGTTVDAYHALKSGRINQDNWEKTIVPELMKSYTNQLGNKTFMQGSNEFFKAYSNPDQYLDSYIARMGASFVPAVAAQSARAADPKLRLERSTGERVQGRIPGMREDLPPRYDLLGREEATGDPDATFAGRLFNPFYQKLDKDEPILRLMGTVGARVTEVGRNIEVPQGFIPAELRKGFSRDLRIELPVETWSQFQREVGQEAYRRLKPLEPSLRRGSPHRARARIEAEYERARTKARVKILRQLKKDGVIRKEAKKAHAEQQQEMRAFR